MLRVERTSSRSAASSRPLKRASGAVNGYIISITAEDHMDNVLKPLFEGSDDEQAVVELFHRVSPSKNNAQRIFYLVWDAVEVLNGDGFGTLLESEISLEEYADCFVKIGMPQVRPIFDQVISLIPFDIRSQADKRAVFLHLRRWYADRPGEDNRLLYEFYDKTAGVVPIVCQFVRDHRDDFADCMNV